MCLQNGLNMGLWWWDWVKKPIYRVPSAVVNKEGHADSLLGYERTHQYWFPLKKYNCKQCFLLPTLETKFTILTEPYIIPLFITGTMLVYI